MAVKLSSFPFLCRIPKRVCVKPSISTLSCANTVYVNPENDQNPSNFANFESTKSFLRSRLHPESLVEVLDSTADVHSSLKLFKWASLQKMYKHSLETYYLMILKLGLAGNVLEMECLCNEMVKENYAGFDRVLLALMDAFIEKERFDEALRVLSCLNSGSFRPSMGVFNCLMGALVKEKGDLKDVIFVYKEMVKVGILPNVETLNYLLEALFEADRVDTSLDQYRRMSKKGCIPNSRTFEVLISGLIAKERVHESLAILDEMLGSECELEARFYDRVIPLLCCKNKHVEAMKLIGRMKASETIPHPSTYGAMIQCLCRNLHMDDVIRIFEDMLDGGVTPVDDVFVYVDVVRGLCELNRFRDAKKILVDNGVDVTRPYNVLLEALCKVADLVAAKDLFDDMFERNLTDSQSWNFLISCLNETGRVKKALEILCRMIVFSFVPDSATYSALIIGKCKQIELDNALALFEQVKSNGQVLEYASYDELVRFLSVKERAREAAEVFCYMSSKKVPLQFSTFSLLIKGVCAMGDVDCVIRFLLLAHYSGTSCSSATYNSIMNSLLKSGKMDCLLMVLSRMVVEGCPVEEETYCISVQCLSAADDPEHCARIFNLMLNKCLHPDSDTVVSALLCLTKHHRLHLILGTIDELMFCSDVLDSNSYNMLISGLCKESYRAEAGRILDVMLSKGWIPKAETHQLLIGSAVDGRSEVGSSLNGSFGSRDEVSSILAEALAQA